VIRNGPLTPFNSFVAAALFLKERAGAVDSQTRIGDLLQALVATLASHDLMDSALWLGTD
jgi:hypothetical protein